VKSTTTDRKESRESGAEAGVWQCKMQTGLESDFRIAGSHAQQCDVPGITAGYTRSSSTKVGSQTTSKVRRADGATPTLLAAVLLLEDNNTALPLQGPTLPSRGRERFALV
jgi:hypothetical protein